MIFAIPNPKKDFNIPNSIENIVDVIDGVELFSQKYRIVKKNTIINVFTFESFEFLSIGVYIDITLKKIDDNNTNCEIEIRRKVGTFNQSHEITLANEHIHKISELITQSINNPDEVQKLLVKKENEIMQKKLAVENHNKKIKEEIENNPFNYYLRLFLIFSTVILFFYFLLKFLL